MPELEPLLPGFQRPARYPEAAGYKEPATSREAAETVDAATLRGEVLSALLEYGPQTPDECAASIGRSVLAIRPRFTELRHLGMIERTGERRTNASGMSAWVLRRKAVL